MCPRDDFLISIIDGPGRKPSEFANPFRLAQKAMAKFLSSRPQLETGSAPENFRQENFSSDARVRENFFARTRG
jgi:hypothetical protein